MAKRDTNEFDRERVKVEEEEPEEVTFATVRLALRKDVVLKIDGPITGIQYVFNRAGSILEVDERDAEIMLQRKGSGSCCSGDSGPTAYFEVVR